LPAWLVGLWVGGYPTCESARTPAQMATSLPGGFGIPVAIAIANAVVLGRATDEE
jgi:hypothetical protein